MQTDISRRVRRRDLSERQRIEALEDDLDTKDATDAAMARSLQRILWTLVSILITIIGILVTVIVALVAKG